MKAMQKGQSSKQHGVSKNITKKKKSQRAKWSDQEKKRFTEILRNFHQDMDGGITKLFWEKVVEEMKENFPDMNRSTEQFRQLRRDLKKCYESSIQDAIDHGLKFSRERCILEGSKDVWAKALQANPNLEKYRGKNFNDYYVDLDILYGSDHSEPPTMKTADDPSSPDEKNSLQYPGNSQHKASSSRHLSTDIPSANLDLQKPAAYKPRSIPGIPECIREYYKLVGLKVGDKDKHHVPEIFRESDNRRIFISLNKEFRAEWLRQAVEERKEQAGPSK